MDEYICIGIQKSIQKWLVENEEEVEIAFIRLLLLVVVSSSALSSSPLAQIRMSEKG